MKILILGGAGYTNVRLREAAQGKRSCLSY
jgi:hypothetical protein